MVFRERQPHKGVILLRLENECAVSKISALQRLLHAYSDQIAGRFVVVTEAGIRIVTFP